MLLQLPLQLALHGKRVRLSQNPAANVLNLVLLLRDDSLLLINGDQVLRVYRLLLAQVVLANGLDLSKELYFLLDGTLDRLLIFRRIISFSITASFAWYALSDAGFTFAATHESSYWKLLSKLLVLVIAPDSTRSGARCRMCFWRKRRWTHLTKSLLCIGSLTRTHHLPSRGRRGGGGGLLSTQSVFRWDMA